MPFQGSITNDVVRAQDIDANTEWIVTFPLKGYKTFGPDVVEIDGEPRDCTSLGQAEEPGKPFLERRAESPWLIWAGGDSWGGFSDLAPLPIVRVKAALCRAVNLIAFGNSESMFLPDDSVLRERMLDSGFSFPLFIEAPSLGAQLYLGSAPVVGFRATTFVNGTLQGGKVLANYMLLRPHRVE
ncbi:MAG: hypothetical protein R3E54_03530 [Halioglobus sp.]